ncbi:hypothetical protein BC828DRAFT_407759 [Blastocladiella britannica]|nr:hypothetical protein BC828DRAFT_407759 [Blastocladiella britannica]
MARDHVKRTCCFFIDIRKGIIFLLTLQFLYLAVTAILLGTGIAQINSTADDQTVDGNGNTVDGSVYSKGLTGLGIASVVVLAVEALFALFGLYCVLKRNVSGFKVFTIVTALFLIYNIISVAISRPVSITYIIACVINAYIVYVYWSYIDTMREEKGQLVSSV